MAAADTVSLNNRLQAVELLYNLQLTAAGKVLTIVRDRLRVEADVTGTAA